jgi:hypothetical protein
MLLTVGKVKEIVREVLQKVQFELAFDTTL